MVCGLGTSSALAAGAFDDAVKLFEGKKYKEAAAKLEGLVKEGKTGANVYYNLGNAYYHTGRKARAVWAYEKAFRLDPRDPDIRWNLNVVRKQVPDKPEGQASPERWLAAKLEPFRSDELAWVFSAIAALLAALMLAYAFLPSQREWVRKAAGPTSLIFTVLVLCLWVRWNELRRPSAIVADKEVYVRYGPSDDSTRAFLLHEGAKVRVLKESGKWASVEFGSGQTGWLPVSAIIRM